MSGGSRESGWQRDAASPKQQFESRAIVGEAADGLSKSHPGLCTNGSEA